MKKILAIVLCVAAVLSVMTVMGFATQGMRNPAAASDAPPPPSSDTNWWVTTTQAPGTNTSTTRWNPLDTWNKVKNGYNNWILTWQKILLAALRIIQFLTGNFRFLRPS